ncbi:ferredoxin [Dactylosporangium sp. CA-233914]|uniref:ferredoxin n=1 Tax=Dactylosporangium sp. CA-233914 TaxID=3239934 RepID=UPI003D8F1880
MKLRVDRTLCLNSGLCAGLAPDVLDLDEQGALIVLDENPPSHLHEDVRQAISYCPVHALSLTED